MNNIHFCNEPIFNIKQHKGFCTTRMDIALPCPGCKRYVNYTFQPFQYLDISFCDTCFDVLKEYSKSPSYTDPINYLQNKFPNMSHAVMKEIVKHLFKKW